jgi:hypothetical protein
MAPGEAGASALAWRQTLVRTPALGWDFGVLIAQGLHFVPVSGVRRGCVEQLLLYTAL